jgi:putative colanic acid biosynthesis acetyltransferase WcaF
VARHIAARALGVKGKNGFSHRLAGARRVYWESAMDLSKYDNSDFQRGAPAWKEFLWWVARSLCFECWFPLPSGLRCAVLRAFGAKIGRGVVVRSHVNITFPWRLEVGDHVWIGDDVLILSLDRVAAGAFVGPGVVLGPGTVVAAGAVVLRSAGPDEFVAGNPAVARPRKTS